MIRPHHDGFLVADLDRQARWAEPNKRDRGKTVRGGLA
jgi:hypothetical protein